MTETDVLHTRHILGKEVIIVDTQHEKRQLERQTSTPIVLTKKQMNTIDFMEARAIEINQLMEKGIHIEKTTTNKLIQDYQLYLSYVGIIDKKGVQ